MLEQNLWFTSDLHFGNSEILKEHNRPFSSVKEMDTKIIKNWNKVVSEYDTVFILGNFTYDTRLVKPYLNFLKGNIHLIFGEYDKYSKNKKEVCNLFKTTNDYAYIKVEDDDNEYGYYSIALFHYPIEVWSKKLYGSWHLHAHSNIPENETIVDNSKILRMSVSTDENDFYPVSYTKIKEIMLSKNI